MKEKAARHVGNIIEDLLHKWQAGPSKKADAVRTAWREAVEKEAKGHAAPVNFKRGILTVIVKDSVWLYKLTLEKKNILTRFNEHYAGRVKARDIRFRVGEVGRE